MKPETNLFLRALIGEKKSRLLVEDARIPLRCSPEDADRIIQINQELKALNSALSELKAEDRQCTAAESTEPVQQPLTISIPVLSPETVQVIRDSLANDVKSAENCYSFVKSTLAAVPLHDSCSSNRALREAEKICDRIRHAKDEFNALYPIPKEKD